MVEEEGVPGGWKVGVRARSSSPFVKRVECTGVGETTGGGVEGEGEEEIPFLGEGEVGSGICVGSTCSGCGSSLTSGSCSGAGVISGSGEPTHDA